MNKRGLFVAAATLSGVLVSAPVLAAGNGFMCGGKDGNGCSVSPVSYKACARDLKGDIKELRCDTFDLIREIFKGRDVKDELAEIRADLAEIQFDLAVLKGLKRR